MSLLKCPECNNGVSEYAEKCPVCGCPINIIKKNYDINSIKYSVKIKAYPNNNKIEIVSKVMKITSFKIAQAKDIVDNYKIIKYNITFQEAEHIKQEIEVFGGEVDIIPYTKEQASLPKCPTCHSTNIEKISTGKKIKGSLLFGVLSSDVRNTMHCKNCGAKW